MIWPGNLVSVTLMNAMYEHNDKKDPTALEGLLLATGGLDIFVLELSFTISSLDFWLNSSVSLHSLPGSHLTTLLSIRSLDALLDSH